MKQMDSSWSLRRCRREKPMVAGVASSSRADSARTGGVCYGKGESFFNGGLKDISTTLLANQHSNGIVEVYEDKQVWSQQDEG